MTSLPRRFSGFVEKYATGERDAQGYIHSPDLKVTFGYWVHKDRYQNHMKLVLDSLKPNADTNLLSFGIDNGLFEIFLAKNVITKGRITSFVPDEKTLEAAKLIAEKEGVKNVEFKVLSLDELSKLREGHYDSALSIAVMHTTPYYARVLEETKRALKPANSRALVTYSPDYFDKKLGVPKEEFDRHVSTNFSVVGRGVALSHDQAKQYYGAMQDELIRSRGFGIQQQYVVLKPRVSRAQPRRGLK